MADESEQIGQDDIENLLQQAQAAATGAGGEQAPTPKEGAALDQGEIEALMNQGESGAAIGQADALLQQQAASTTAASPATVGATDTAQSSGAMGQGDIEVLLNRAEQALASVDEPTSSLPPHVQPFEFRDLSGSPPSSEAATLDLLQDVQLDVKIELGRALMQLEDVLQLKKGAVVPLDKLAGDPVDIYVNGRLIARGEVLVLNDNFCVRVAELAAGESPTPL